MTRIEYPYAGLILPDSQHMDSAPYIASARDTMLALYRGFFPEQDGPNLIFGEELGVRVTPEEESDFGPRMLIEVITTSGQTPDEAQDEMAAQLLSDTVLKSLEHSTADILEWYSPDVLLDVEDFIRLRSYVSPRRALPQHMQDAPDVDHIANDSRSRLAPKPLTEVEIDFDAIPAVGKRNRAYPPARPAAPRSSDAVTAPPAAAQPGLRSAVTRLFSTRFGRSNAKAQALDTAPLAS
ncbi:MAG: hypothetical protein N4A61_04690 [Pelagimonas sp.]|jgi:hypothetical protein|nr:hypothetical protein [Pelagimonas sp.]